MSLFRLLLAGLLLATGLAAPVAPAPAATFVDPVILKAKRSDTADGWAAQVSRRGGTYSAATLTALRALDADLQLFDLKRKLVYFNPRAGSDITAAKVPMIARVGPGFDVASGTFAAWNEANGLVNSSAGVMDTGVTTTAKGMQRAAFSLGCYMLNNASNGVLLGDTSLSGLQPQNASTYHIMDYGSQRMQTDSTLIADGTQTLTKGLVAGSFYGAGVGVITRNGVIRGAYPPVVAAGSSSSFNQKLYAAIATSAGEFIGTDFTPDDIANFTWMWHAFNTALGRQVTAEGMN